MKTRIQHIEQLEKDFPICLQPIIEKIEKEFHKEISGLFDLFKNNKSEIKNDISAIRQKFIYLIDSLKEDITIINEKLKENENNINNDIINEINEKISNLQASYESLFEQVENITGSYEEINQIVNETESKLELIKNEIESNNIDLPILYVKQDLTPGEIIKNKNVIDSFTSNETLKAFAFTKNGLIPVEVNKDSYFVSLKSYISLSMMNSVKTIYGLNYLIAGLNNDGSFRYGFINNSLNYIGKIHEFYSSNINTNTIHTIYNRISYNDLEDGDLVKVNDENGKYVFTGFVKKIQDSQGNYVIVNYTDITDQNEIKKYSTAIGENGNILQKITITIINQ